MTQRSWFAIHTHVGREFEAETHLKHQGFEVYLPVIKCSVTHARKTSWKPRAFLPGYLFLNLAPDQRRWTSIRSTRGVIAPVRFGAHFPAIDPAVIAAFRTREDADGHIVLAADPAAPFREGERVRVLDGAMTDLTGVFSCMQGQDRAVVFLELLQRQVRVSLSTSQLAAA